ncbi:MAG: hypothetical protein AB7H70_14295 [Rhodospirillaceae bacterium]|jgi:hypothetical protein
MLDLSFRQIGPGLYVKWNPVLGIRTTVRFENGLMHVKHEQRVDDVLDLNVAQQNDFTGYRGKELVQATRIPMIEHRKIMERCGFQAGAGYDLKKFKQILNDRDYCKFKTVPGKI